MNKRTGPSAGAHLWLILWKAYRAVEEHGDRSIDSLGLGGLSDFALLEVLLHKGPLPVNAIGRKVLLTSGSMTAAVDRAERQGFVERRPSAVDRRVVEVHLTAAGRRTIEAAFAEHARNLDRLATSLSPDEQRTLIELLKKLGRSAEAMEKPGRPGKP